MFRFLALMNKFVWGVPALVLILTVGIGLSIQTKFLQIRWLPAAIFQGLLGNKAREAENGISSRKALCTALAATVGTGNLAGVAGAIAIGGPGAVFWMWLSALMGMMIKFTEVVLAMKYRQRNIGGEWLGGPMYMIKNGLPYKMHFLAYAYCFLGVVAAFGIGNAVQVNSIIGSCRSIISAFTIHSDRGLDIVVGVLLAIFVTYAFGKGAVRIGKLSEILVPLAAGIYILLALIALFICRSNIPNALISIIHGAFQPSAVTGGFVGSVFISIRIGMSRGIFTNEAGMGTASIAHAQSSEVSPVKQGLLGIAEVFLDTVVICTLTALVILCSNVRIPYGNEVGIYLTMEAFSSVYGDWVCILLAMVVCLLATATILGWGLYGVRCMQFLFGAGAWRYFSLLQSITVVLGAIMNTSQVWVLSELVNGLMTIPNLIALIWLMPVFFRIIKAYRHL